MVYYDRVGTFLFAGWFLHYFPFFLMGRQLFLHHYFPALYFALLLLATAFDLATSKLRPRVRLSVAMTLVGGAVIAWWYLAPLAYAGVWTRGQCERAKRLGRSWDFSCADFHEKVSAEREGPGWWKAPRDARLTGLGTPQLSDYSPQLAESAQTTVEDAAASASTSIAAAAVQPGRGGFEPVEKAPASSAVPDSDADERPRREAAEAGAVRDEDRDGPLFVDGGARARGEEEQRAREMTTGVVADQPMEAPGAHPEDDGVAIPAAAEGTTALPIKAILQAEEGGGGKAAGPKDDAEEAEPARGRRRPQAAVGGAAAPEEEEDVAETVQRIFGDADSPEEEEEEEPFAVDEAEIDFAAAARDDHLD